MTILNGVPPSINETLSTVSILVPVTIVSSPGFLTHTCTHPTIGELIHTISISLLEYIGLVFVHMRPCNR